MLFTHSTICLFAQYHNNVIPSYLLISSVLEFYSVLVIKKINEHNYHLKLYLWRSGSLYLPFLPWQLIIFN